MQPDFMGRTLDDAQQIFAQLELTAAFWRPDDAE
jgi:hypothetical protein